MKKKNQRNIEIQVRDFLLYTTPNGRVEVEILLQNENVWLTQTKIAELFGVQRPAITKHLKNIFDTNELVETSVSSILEHTAKDAKNYLNEKELLGFQKAFLQAKPNVLKEMIG